MQRILLAISFIALIGSSCEKNDSSPISETESLVRNIDNGVLNDLYNTNNPYDQYGMGLSELYEDIEVALSQENISLLEFENEVNNLINNSTYSSYPTMDTSGYSLSESQYFYDFVQGVDESNLVSRSRLFEDSLALNTTFTDVQKNRLYSLISQFKFNHYFGEEVAKEGSRKPKLTACLDEQMSNIFGDDNPVDDIAFIIGVPFSFVWEVAYCAYEIATD